MSTFALQQEGLAAIAGPLAMLRDFGRDAVLMLVDGVLAERLAAPKPAELVWTGPDQRASAARDTAVVLADLFERSREQVLLAGFAFDHADEVLRPLWEARKRGVEVRLFVDEKAADAFENTSWPFGPPLPELFVFRPPPGVYASLHAKCVVVDQRWCFVTSANFTSRGQTRNVEVGVLLDDGELARRLIAQFPVGEAFMSRG
jgi:phosphatidylserine/phosphatidylglycerophosphate/cardiolipin synthase-like enzyme